MIYLHYFTVGGHDSKEDAVAALDLMKYKVKEDLKRLWFFKNYCYYVVMLLSHSNTHYKSMRLMLHRKRKFAENTNALKRRFALVIANRGLGVISANSEYFLFWLYRLYFIIEYDQIPSVNCFWIILQSRQSLTQTSELISKNSIWLRQACTTYWNLKFWVLTNWKSTDSRLSPIWKKDASKSETGTRLATNARRTSELTKMASQSWKKIALITWEKSLAIVDLQVNAFWKN